MHELNYRYIIENSSVGGGFSLINEKLQKIRAIVCILERGQKIWNIVGFIDFLVSGFKIRNRKNRWHKQQNNHVN